MSTDRHGETSIPSYNLIAGGIIIVRYKNNIGLTLTILDFVNKDNSLAVTPIPQQPLCTSFMICMQFALFKCYTEQFEAKNGHLWGDLNCGNEKSINS